MKKEKTNPKIVLFSYLFIGAIVILALTGNFFRAINILKFILKWIWIPLIAFIIYLIATKKIKGFYERVLNVIENFSE